MDINSKAKTKGLQFWKSPARNVFAIPNIPPAPEEGNTELIEQLDRKN